MTNVEKKPLTAAELTETARNALLFLVRREERRLGTRGLAYWSVSQTICASSSWIKKFLSRHPEVKEPRLTLFLNIRAAYEEACRRVELEYENERAELAVLKGQLNAVDRGFVETVRSETETEKA